MTIKELCDNQEECETCSFVDACKLLDCNPPFKFDEGDDNFITRSIIETARILTEGNNHDTSI